MAYLWTGDFLSHLFDMWDLAGIGRLMNSIFHVQKIEKYAGCHRIWWEAIYVQNQHTTKMLLSLYSYVI